MKFSRPFPSRRFVFFNPAILLAAAFFGFLMPAHGTLYYLNDLSMSGDVYAGAVGSDANDGLAPATPKLTFTNLLATYNLVAGDVVYIDTGTYTNYSTTITNAGTGGSPIIIQGSTNYPAGGTVFDRRSSSFNVITLLSARNINLHDLTLRGGQNGFGANAITNVILDRVLSVSNSSGFFLGNSSVVFLRRCASARNSVGLDVPSGGPIYWDQGVMWSNTTSINIPGTVSVSNSVIVGGILYSSLSARPLDYTILWNVTYPGGADYLSDFIAATTNDGRIAVVDPLFANPAGFDFHVSSVVGRHNPATGLRVTDLVHSVAIDFGNPALAYTNEPEPRGEAINVGLFGHHPEASQSPTNPWYFAYSYNDGGTLTGTGSLRWTYGAVSNGTTVRLQYSTDSGTSWSNIASGLSVTNRQHTWVATGTVSSLNMIWRVQDETLTNVWDRSDSNFTLKASAGVTFTAYVNDTTTAGDVYCSAAGSAGNDGLSPATPRTDLPGVLDAYDFGPGDVIYVDTGLYTTRVAIAAADRGSGGLPLMIIGSTNLPAGGSNIDRGGGSVDGISIGSSANFIHLYNLTVRNSRYAIDQFQSQACEFHDMRMYSNLNGYRGVTVFSNRLLRCLAVGNGVGFEWSGGGANLLDLCVSWSNTSHLGFGGSGVGAVSNTIIGGGGTAFGGAAAPSNSNHLLFWNVSLGGGFISLYDFQKSRNGSWQSSFGDPAFAGPTNLPYYLSSTAGRYDPLTDSFVTDAVYSAAIDFADPLRPVGDETAPNGSRVNAGIHGGTVFASRSATSFVLRALSLQDGGQLSVGDSVYWSAVNAPTGATVRIEFSGDGGFSWNTVATNLAATNGVYAWTSTNHPSSTLARWRVVYESDPLVLSVLGTNFTFRNGPFLYYLNDSSTTGDLYTTAAGSDANAGSTPASPKATFTNLLATVDLEPGDVVYIDTGRYRSSVTPVITVSDSGVATNLVIFQFSTNWVAGGAIQDRLAAGIGLDFASGSGHVDIRNAVMTNCTVGVRVTSATGVRLTGARFAHMKENGIVLVGAVSATVERCAVYLNATNGLSVSGTSSAHIRHSVFWRNRGAQVAVDGGVVSITNSILVTAGSGAPVYRVATATNIQANYNGVFAESNAAIAAVGTLAEGLDTLSAWQHWTGQDRLSLDADPYFADPVNGDFHLKTQTAEGRYDPLSGLFLSDPVTSPMIDAADPGSGFSNEPAPNGSRANIGMFGNTSEASRGRTAAWLLAASLRQGGWVKGTATLHWVAGNLATDSHVRVDISLNGGHSWQTLSTGVVLAAESVAWDTTATNNTPAGLWRVVSLADTNVSDSTTNFFAVRNATLALYLNDAATSNDTYTSAAGAATNWVATAAQPLNSLALAVSRFDLEPGDVLYVDAGTYAENANIEFTRLDGGLTNQPVLILGPTNGFRAIHQRGSTAVGSVGVSFSGTRAVALSNLVFHGARVGVQVDSSAHLSLGIGATANSSNGFSIITSTNISLRRVFSSANGGRGLFLGTNTTVVLEHAVLWSNTLGGLQLRSGTVEISNSVVHATGTGRYAYELNATTDVLRANFNNVVMESSAQAMLRAGQALRFLSNVRSTLGQELNSLSHPPGFADSGALDFSLASEAGRFAPGSGIVTDGVTSVMIDSGDPARSAAVEPAPNGERVNIGLYGQTDRASFSRTNAWLLAVTLNDGGVVRGTNAIYWVAGGVATGHLVTVQFSADAGATWTNVATNLTAATGIYTNWDTTVHGSTLLGYWRVVSESDTNVLDVTDAPFVLNNGALTYYVNDGSTNGDVYATAPGASLNDGSLPSAPAASVEEILSRYALNAGDRILIDTGTYSLNATFLVDGTIVGSATNPIVFQGSTNVAAGGTVFDRNQGDTAIELRGAVGLSLRDLVVRRARRPFYVNGVTNVSFEHVGVEGGKDFLTQPFGYEIQNSSTVLLNRCAVYGVTNANGVAIRASTVVGLRLLNCVSWSNQLALEVISSQAVVSNSTFSAFGSAASAYRIALGAAVSGNYNNFDLRNGAVLARETVNILSPSLTGVQTYDSLTSWQRVKGVDLRSLSHEPDFADPDTYDFHLRSQGGRWQPGVGVVTDLVSSVLLDAGDPGIAPAGEPSPNGGRINIGRYGNTVDASRTPTNGRLTAVALNDGGIAAGTNVTLYWIAGGDVTNHQLRVDISYDDGFAWVLLASNLAGTVSTLQWDTTSWLTQPLVRWRVQSQVNSNIVDLNDRWFQIRNSNVVYYVNDGNLTGDVYTTAAGYEFNNGLASNMPKPFINDVLEQYDLEPGDTIYVDTGVYSPTGVVTWGYQDSGSAAERVALYGSTNRAAGGSDLVLGMQLDNARSLMIQDLVVSATGAVRNFGLNLQSVSNLWVTDVAVRGAPGNGFAVRESTAVLFERCAVAGAVTNGLFDTGSSGTRWLSGVLWSNRTGLRSQALAAGPLAMSNTLVAALAANQIGLIVASNAWSDYNAYWVTNGAQVANEFVTGREFPLQYLSVGRWAADTLRDTHTLAVNPDVVPDPVGYYLRSQAGRFDPSTGLFTNDATTSPLVDAGDPLAVATNEPAPNGERLNIGLQGNTDRASKTPTNASLLVVSLRDGGVARAEQLLYWVARGDATGHTVLVEYSPDMGLTWTNVATNVPASGGSYTWTSTSFPSTVLGLWRVSSESQPAVTDISRQPFAVRNGPVLFYVNDAATAGDVYSLVAGSETNLGVSPASPLLDLQDLLDRYDLEPGDVVYVDTGSYSNSASISIGQQDSGSSSGLGDVIIQGSTNEAAGGSRMVAVSAQPVFEVFDGRYISFRDVRLDAGAGSGFLLQKTIAIRFDRVAVRNGQYAFQTIDSQQTVWRQCVAQDYLTAGLAGQSAASLNWEAGVFWSGGTSAVQLANASLSMSNSIVGAWGANRFVYRLDFNSTLNSDYNGVWLDEGAMMGYQTVLSPLKYPMIWETLSRWARDTGRDRFSVFGDPRFHDSTNGSFYLRSEGGRFDPVAAAFTNDTVTSPFIDAGAPLSAFGSETAPNGGRLNLGPQGNTARASRTPTNSALLTVSLNDGGRAEGSTWPLFWLARGNATGHTVRLEYSSNTGVSWSVIATGLPARVVSPYFWDSTAFTSTVHSLWRVASEIESGVQASNARPFALRNQGLRFYVNDSAVTGDVYTAAPGDSGGNGTDPAQPRDSLQSVLDSYDIEPGDVIYLDTGVYQLADTPIRWSRFDAWNSMTNLAALQAGGISVLLQGSTNVIAGGSLLTAIDSPVALVLTQALGVAVKNVDIRRVVAGSGVGIEVVDSQYVSLQWMQIRNGSDGFYINQSSFVGISNALAQGHSIAGLRTRLSSDTRWQGGVLWSNTYGVLQDDGAAGSLTVLNTAFGAVRTGAFAIIRVQGVLSSDYNDIFRTNGGFTAGLIQGGSIGGGTTRYETVTSWFNQSGNDGRTLASDPRFASLSDFHLQSPEGRYVTGTGFITNVSDAFSPLIDAGNPSSPYALESAPNGGRVNIGVYGNSPEASRSPSNGLLTTITFNDGGSAEGTIELRWNASGVATGQFVTIQFSNNGGLTWTNVATNVPGNLGSYSWNSAPYGRAAAGLWRLFSQTDTNVQDVTDRFFALRNGGSIPYYVNDGATAGDVYCTSAGNDDFDGYLPSTPKATLQALLAAVDLEPGDIVYVDTGTYLLSQTLTVGDLDAGTASNRVVIQGSTNRVAGGTVFNRQTGAGTGIEIFQTAGIELRDLRVINAAIGVSLREADQCKIVRVRSDLHNSAAFSSDLVGTNLFEGCIAAFSSNGLIAASGWVQWHNGIIYGNGSPILLNSSGSLDIRNSFVSAVGSSRRIFSVTESGGSITADYNSYRRQENALLYERTRSIGGPEIYPSLTDWQLAYGQDLRTLTMDPLMVNPDAGEFNLQSATGRFLENGSLTNDPGVFSPLIDTGDPAFAYTNETGPNGGRINIGNFGNTPFASLSQTNPWLLALSFNDGGTIRGTVTVYWAAGGMSSTNLVRLEQALDGVDFTPFASNIPAFAGSYTWDVSALPPSPLARWRVVCEACSASDQNDASVYIRNSALTIYINDGDTAGDVYTSAEGHPTNSGLSADSPLHDPDWAFQKFILGPDDVIYIDTGSYTLTNSAGMQIGLVGSVLEQGLSNQPIRIQGSTNTLSGGSLIAGLASSNAYAMQILDTRNVEVADVRLSGSGRGLQITRSTDISLRRIELFEHSLDGLSVSLSAPVIADRLVSRDNAGYGIQADSDAMVQLDHGVLWDNTKGAITLSASQLWMTNSILHSSVTNTYLVSAAGTTLSAFGDYNIFWVTNGAEIGRDQTRQLFARNLKAWQVLAGGDTNSAVLDPLLAQPGLGDVHLMSEAGRFNPATTSFVLDAATSWAIDAGEPAADASEETAPNGGRVNAGRYGGTVEASRTMTNSATRAVRIVSFNDGGQMTEAQPLNWYARGYTGLQSLRLEYSANNGLTWSTVATNIPATNQTYFWSPHPTNSSPVALWRLVDESDPARAVTNQRTFALRLQPLVFYVNDASTTGDIYATAVGSPTNNALTPGSPMDSIADVVDRYDLESFDQILVDTGYYVITNAVRLRSDDGGVNTNYVYITGSTNRLAGGTQLDRQSANLGSLLETDEIFNILDSSFFDISHLTLLNANAAISLNLARSCVFSNIVITSGGRTGIESAGGGPNYYRRILVTDHLGSGLVLAEIAYIDSSVVWSNGGSAILANAGALYISNSVLHATGTNYCYRLGESAVVRADFNDLYTVGGSRPALLGNLELEGLPQWTLLSGEDARSVSIDPLFYDPLNMDFHPRSPAGRFDPVSGVYVVTDAVYSYLVDTGATNHPYASEPAPNGERRNIGLHGDTSQASKGRTNEWLLALTGSSGGRLSGQFNLHWAWGQMDPTNTVHIDFSYDDGTNWIRVATNRPVSSGQFFWDTTTEPLAVTPIARWRLLKVADTNVYDVTDLSFALNGPFGFYVNDSSTNCDVFTTAVGTNSNLGIYPSIPKASLRDVVETWDMDAGDTVYIDTGYYPMSTNDLIVIGDSDAGLSGEPVRFVASTNCLGAQFEWIEVDGSPYLVRLQGSHFDLEGFSFYKSGVEALGTNIALRNVTLSNAVAFLAGADTVVSNMNVIGGTVQSAGRNQNLTRIIVRGGFIQLNGSEVTLQNSLAYGTQTVSATIGGTNITLINNSLVARRTAVIVDGGDASATLRNNIIVADGDQGDAFAIQIKSGAINSDYNNIVARNRAWIGNVDGYWERLLYWQRASGQDLNSISVEPLFADESNGDLHPQSTAGRWTPLGFVIDPQHAMTIDLGSPSSSFARETAPNGSRINLGAFGNTAEASRSRVDPWLFAITMNDGGVLKGTNTLRWASGNLTNGATVTIRYSPDNGASWTSVAAGVTASAGQYEWDSTGFTSSLHALWDVVLETDTNVRDQVDGPFALRNTPLNFYVNDAATAGDVYTLAVGATTNDGLTTSTPMRWLSDLLDTYDTEGGDVVYVDTGSYSLTQNVVVIWSRGGDPTNGPLWIWGSTNFPSGGSVFSRNLLSPDSAALDIKASHVRVRNMTMKNAAAGVLLDSNRFVVIERMNLVSNMQGVVIRKSFEPALRNNVFRHNVTGGVEIVQSVSNTVENNTFHANPYYGIRLDSAAPNVLQNNIFSLNTTNTAAYAGVLDEVFIDYNVYYFTTNNVAIFGSQSNLLAWQLATARDYRSAATNPLFANLAGGDFHLESFAGRWVDGAGFTSDVQTSWAVDRGATNSAYDLEAVPNGARINIGAYGNTEYASKGLVSTQIVVETRILNTPTFIRETNSIWPLIWSVINVPTTELFHVQFSGDGGDTWYTISNNVPAYREVIVWQASPFFNTYRGLWRVVGVGDTNYWDVNDAQFQLFFGTFRVTQIYYDQNTNGIVFRGAWDEQYQVQWATNVSGSNYVWWDAVDGTGAQELASFLSTNGGDFIYRDRDSTNQRFRLYRVLQE